MLPPVGCCSAPGWVLSILLLLLTCLPALSPHRTIFKNQFDLKIPLSRVLPDALHHEGDKNWTVVHLLISPLFSVEASKPCWKEEENWAFRILSFIFPGLKQSPSSLFPFCSVSCYPGFPLIHAGVEIKEIFWTQPQSLTLHRIREGVCWNTDWSVAVPACLLLLRDYEQSQLSIFSDILGF